MNKNELKKILKPLIKQCIKEVVFEEGVLSSIITEVVRGVNPTGQQLVRENNTQKSVPQDLEKQQVLQARWKKEQERKRQLLNATGFQGVDLFEGTEPLSSAGSPNSAPAVQGALGGIDPNDSGVDISGILAVGSGNWSKLIGGKK
jgi:hypothetical protein|tara:strand:+ start:2987 stop:3424 length:438 start_codon:yes stop_codon:yes gene_type:complete